jgi:hypothetical protein
MFLVVLQLFYYCTYACEYIFGGWAALGFELSLTFGKQVLYHLSHLPAYIFLFKYLKFQKMGTLSIRNKLRKELFKNQG